MGIGEDIKAKRKADRLSANDLAIKLGLKMENIYKWESGSIPSDPEEYAKVAAWLNNSEYVPIIGDKKHVDVLQVVLGRIAALTETQNQILKQNQDEIVGGIKDIKSDLNSVRQENQTRAFAITTQIQDLGKVIHQDFRKFGRDAPLKEQGKTAGKSAKKTRKQGNRDGVHK